MYPGTTLPSAAAHPTRLYYDGAVLLAYGRRHPGRIQGSAQALTEGR